MVVRSFAQGVTRRYCIVIIIINIRSMTTSESLTMSSSSISGGSTTVSFSSEQFQQLMSVVSSASDMQAALDGKLERLKTDLLKEQELSNKQVAKRARLEKPQVFKSKGNEEQHRFLEKALHQLDDAQVELERAVAKLPAGSSSSSESVKRAMEFVKTSKCTLQKRQKLIRMADRSELGWMVVSEYEEDELADDEDDAKRMAKAQKDAEKKFEAVLAKKKRKVANSNRLQVAGSSGSRHPSYRAASGIVFLCGR